MNTNNTPQKNKSDIFPIFVLVATVLIVLLVTAIVTLSKSEQKFGNTVHGVKYANYVYRYAEEFHVDPNLVFAIIKNESGFDPDAWLQNYKYGTVSLDEDELFNPDVNIKYGCIFLEFLTQKYEVTSTVVASYNAGFGIVDTWLNDSDYSSDGKTLSYIPYSETSAYVKKVMNSKRYYENNLNDTSDSPENDGE